MGDNWRSDHYVGFGDPMERMRAYQQNDIAETEKLYEFADEPRKTLHEFTSEKNGFTIVVFNTKIVVVKENGVVEEFARAM